MWHIWGTGKVHTGLWWRDPRQGDQLEDLGVGGRIALKCIFKEVGCGGTDMIALVLDRDRLQVLVNAVMNLHVP